MTRYSSAEERPIWHDVSSLSVRLTDVLLLNDKSYGKISN